MEASHRGPGRRPRDTRYSREEFETLVAEALDSLPEEIQGWLDNVAVVVANRPTAEQLSTADVPQEDLLFGLYVGVPKTKRGVSYGEVVPDKIVIFQDPIEQVCWTRQEVRRQVRRTVLHEIGHHFGLGEEELRDSGV